MTSKYTEQEARVIIALEELDVFKDTSLLEEELKQKNPALLESNRAVEILIKSLRGESFKGQGKNKTRAKSISNDDVIEDIAKQLNQGQGITKTFNNIADKYHLSPDAIRKIWTRHGNTDRFALFIKRFYGVDK